MRSDPAPGVVAVATEVMAGGVVRLAPVQRQAEAVHAGPHPAAHRRLHHDRQQWQRRPGRHGNPGREPSTGGMTSPAPRSSPSTCSRSHLPTSHILSLPAGRISPTTLCVGVLRDLPLRPLLPTSAPCRDMRHQTHGSPASPVPL